MYTALVVVHSASKCFTGLPPPWMSVIGPMTSRIMVLHSMCQPAQTHSTAYQLTPCYLNST